MALSKEQWGLEQNRLKQIFSLVSANIESLEAKLKKSVVQIRDSNKVMWKEGKSYHYDFDDVVENLSLLDNVYSDMMRHENILAQLKKMYLLRKSAYFGRFDFIEEDTDETDEIYIGTSTLEGKDSSILIYDWRAAISSMFYENEPGKASFFSPAGEIAGEITLKRQYRIHLDKIEAMFNSAIVIEDEILQKILSESKNDRMQTIVSSIQKEQNRAIRDENHRIVYVDGPAGSGKTSIALHRAAWLLYRYREKITARNIIVYSPNEIFNDYISNVLPELGEENMQMSTFVRLAGIYLGHEIRFEDSYSQMESILKKSKYVDIPMIRKKGSRSFAESIGKYVSELGKTGYKISDISSNGTLIATCSELEELFYKDYGMHKISTRLEKLGILLERRLVYITRKIRKKYVETAKQDMNEGRTAAYTAKGTIEELRKKILELTQPDIRQIYLEFLKNYDDGSMAIPFKESLERGFINYEDIAPMMYLKLMLGYTRDFKDIKHLIIDEVQDYSYIEMLVFFNMYPNVQMTLLGDANQAINHVTDSNDLKESVAGDYYRVRINKSYRSTRQIASFCNKLIDEAMNYEYVDRDGPEPYILKSKDLITDLKAGIFKMTSENSSVALIAKTDAEAVRIHAALNNPEIKLIRKSDTSFSNGVVVIPSYLSKGLEFDAVIMVSSLNAPFNGQENRKLFYTGCSRALHELSVVYEGNAPYGIDKL